MFRTTATVFSAICLSSALVFAAPSHSVDPKKARDIMETFDPIIEKSLTEFNIPGMAVGVVVNGQVVFSKGYGLRNIEKKLPVTIDTLFGLGSCTKAFTAFTLATLVEQGVISWDQLIIDALPQFRLHDEHATNHVTFRDLISHRSGMARHPYMWYNSNYSRIELLDRLRYLEQAWDIRERFNYGDLSYLITALAAEQVTGKVWEDLVTERILQPLGMKKTNFSVKDSQKSDNFSLPYLERKGVLKAMAFRDFSNVGPAAGMNSSVRDLLSWTKLLLSGGTYDSKTLLSAGSIQEMFGAQVVASSYTENPDILLSAYGLGWYIHPYRGHYSVSHDGGVDGFTSVVSLFPNNGVGIVILANKNLFNVPRFLSMEIADKLLGLPSRDWLIIAREKIANTKKVSQEVSQDTQRKKGTFPSHLLEEYTGEYEHPAYGTMKIELVDGELVSTLHGISSRLGHWHYDVFDHAEDLHDLLIIRQGLKYTFQSSANGDIEGVSVPLEQKAADIIFKKKPDSKSFNVDFFRPYIGQYSIYGIVVDIVLRNGSLVAMIPGQDEYELEPLSEHEFNVKNDHYLVHFVIGEDGLASEVLLVLPFGAYSADRVRN